MLTATLNFPLFNRAALSNYDRIEQKDWEWEMNSDGSEVSSSKDNMPPLEQWLRRGKDGEKEALASIYEHFKGKVYSLAYRYTYNTAVAEDILQDTFIKVFGQLSSVKSSETFTGWLFRIAINTSLSYLRKNKKHLKQTSSLENMVLEAQSPESTQHEDMMVSSLEKAIGKLPHGLKSVFLLHDVQGFKHEEVARILGCSVGTSKSQLFKARMKLRELFESKNIL
ncbi:MAG: RNA polymerase sigma factor [Acidobacteriota bacterium]